MPIGSGQVQLGNDCRDEYVASSGQIAISSLYRTGTYVPDINQTSTIPTSGQVSFFNFRSTALTTSTDFRNQGLISIQFIVKGNAPDAFCGIYFYENGNQTVIDGGGNVTDSWVNDVSGTPGNYYQIYCTKVSGDNPTAGDTLNTWHDLSTARYWELVRPGGSGVIQGSLQNSLDITIRGKYPQVNIGTINVTMDSVHTT